MESLSIKFAVSSDQQDFKVESMIIKNDLRVIHFIRNQTKQLTRFF